MSQTNTATFDGATIVRWLLFFGVLIALTLVHLLVLFRGLGTPQAMEQAQLGRQVARGEGFQTKVIKPLELHLAEAHEGNDVPLTGLRDTTIPRSTPSSSARSSNWSAPTRRTCGKSPKTN